MAEALMREARPYRAEMRRCVIGAFMMTNGLRPFLPARRRYNLVATYLRIAKTAAEEAPELRASRLLRLVVAAVVAASRTARTTSRTA